MSAKPVIYTERINVFLSPEQLEAIKAEADRLGLTVSAYVRMIVVKAVSKDD